MKIKYLSFPLVLLFLSLTACSSGGGSGDNENVISGVVRLPAQQVVLRPVSNPLVQLAAFFIPTLHADVIGLVPVPNATVELVRIDDTGTITAVLDTTTSDGSGNYNFITTLAPSSDLAVHLPAEANPTRALVSGSNIDITPVSEAVVRSILDDILASTTTLGNYTVSEVAALVDLVNGMDIDVSAAPTFNDAVNTVLSESSSVLTDMVKGYNTAGTNNALARKNYNVVGQSTTLVPPPQLNSVSAGIDQRIIDGAFGFKSTGELASGNFGQLFLILSDLSTSSYFCDFGSPFGQTFIPAGNGQLTVIAADGSGAVSGALATDGSLMFYPTTNFTAAADGLGSGFGRGLQLAMRQATTTPTSGTDLNPLLSGNYNVIWTSTHMDPTVVSRGSLTALTGTATLNYDGGITPPTLINGSNRNSFTSSNTVVESLTVDIATGAVTSGTDTTDTINGIYTVLPDNSVFVELGDPPTLLGGGSGTSDFMRGVHLDPATGNTFSPLAAFSTYVTAGQMASGGGMGMGIANCGTGTGGTVGGGGLQMGASNGEGRGMALAAPQTVGLAAANVSGTYNVVAQLNSLTQGTGTATIDSEIDYGTFTFDGAGAISSGILRYKRSSLDTTDAINGITSAATTTSGTSSYSGSYSVNAVDGTLTFTLTGGFTTGTGFVTNNGDFLALPILSNGANSGSRGLLLLIRQP